MRDRERSYLAGRAVHQLPPGKRRGVHSSAKVPPCCTEGECPQHAQQRFALGPSWHRAAHTPRG